MLNWKAVVLKRCDINISAVSGVSISSRGSLLMHAERDIVMATPSVCPSNACTISKRMHIIITLFDGLVVASFYVSESRRRYKIPRRTSLAGR